VDECKPLPTTGFVALSSASSAASVTRTNSPNFCGLACSICVHAFHHAAGAYTRPLFSST